LIADTEAELLAANPTTEIAEGYAKDTGINADYVQGKGWKVGGATKNPDGSTSFAGPLRVEGALEADGASFAGPVQAPGIAADSASIGIVKTRAALLRPGNVSFNAFDLLNSRLQGYFAGDNSSELQYIKDAGGLYVRVMYPVFSSAQWTTQVFASGIPSRDFVDSDFRATFLQYSDELFADFEEYGLLMNPCLFWGAEQTTGALGETVATGFLAGSATRAFMVRFTKWFGARYGNHPALGFVSFGNEWYPSELSASSPNSAAVLASCYAELSDALSVSAPGVLRTADSVYPVADDSAARNTIDFMIGVYAEMFTPLDAWNLHIYTNFYNYVGRDSVYDSSVDVAPDNDFGYEFLDTSVAAFAAAAHARGKLFIVGEIGVNLTQEAATDSKKQERFYSSAAKYADLTMIWNVQPEDRATVPGSSQTQIYIAPGTPRGDINKKLVRDLNHSIRGSYPVGIADDGARDLASPKAWVTTSTTAASNVVAPVKSAVGAAAFSIMGWFRANEVLADFAQIFRFRTATDDGVSLIASSVDNAVYFSAKAGGTAIFSTSGLHKLTVPGKWNHVAFGYIPGTPNLVDLFIDGVYWTTLQASAAMDTLPIDTTFVLGDDNTATGLTGANASHQDWAILPGRITSQRIFDHASGKVAPESILHLRVLKGGPIMDLSRSASIVTVGASAVYG